MSDDSYRFVPFEERRYRRKSESEIERIKKENWERAKDPKNVILFCFGMSALLGLVLITIGEPNSSEPVKPSWEGFFLLCIMATILSIIGYMIQLLSRRKLQDNPGILICKNCWKPNIQCKKKCDCGGEFESSDYFEEY